MSFFIVKQVIPRMKSLTSYHSKILCQIQFVVRPITTEGSRSKVFITEFCNATGNVMKASPHNVETS